MDHPLLEYPPTPVGEVERRIAGYVADLVPDGATLQVGVGSIPQAVMEALAGKKDLGVHSLLVEHMLPLVRSGVITNARKRLHPGRMDVGEIMGTAALFEWSHENPLVNMEPSDVVHDPEVVGDARRLRLGELGPRGGPARPGERGERGRAAGDGHRRPVRLRAGGGAGGRRAVHHRAARHREPGHASPASWRAWPRARG